MTLETSLVFWDGRSDTLHMFHDIICESENFSHSSGPMKYTYMITYMCLSLSLSPYIYIHIYVYVWQYFVAIALRMVARSEGLPSGLWCIEYFCFANCCDARRPHRH